VIIYNQTGFFGYDEVLDENEKRFSHLVFLGVVTLFLFIVDRQVKTFSLVAGMMHGTCKNGDRGGARAIGVM